jgi:NADPH2:quinone reductase
MRHSMKAVVCTTLGGPEVLKLTDWPSRAPAAGEVRVAIHAAGVNFGDLLVIAGRYQVKLTPPFVLGTEGAGVVIDCGAGVTRFKSGDRVLVQNTDVRECFADEVTLAAERVVPVPGGVSLIDIAGFPLNYGTSYYALAHRAHLQPGEVLAVHGASGGVGLAAVKLGKMLGATVIATGGDDDKLAVVQAEGADHVVNTRREPLAERIRELTGGRGADVSYDPVGGDVFDAALRSTALEGRILVVGFAGGRIPAAPANKILFGCLSVIGAPYGGFTKRQPQQWAEMMKMLLDKVRAGELKPLIHRRFAFDEAADALRLLAARKVIGKCLLLSERGRAVLPLD